MNDQNNKLRKRAIMGVAGVLAATTVAGSAIALSSAANAATTTPTPSNSSSTSTAPKAFNPGGSTPVRSDEKSVSTADAPTLTAAALKEVPGATIIRVETDSGDAAYEVHLTKADGTLATVKFDKSMNFVKVETGMGQGDPNTGGHGPGGTPPTGTAPTGSSSLGTFQGA